MMSHTFARLSIGYLLIILLLGSNTKTYAQEDSLDVYHTQLFEYLDQANMGNPTPITNAFSFDDFMDRMFYDLPDTEDVTTFKETFKISGIESLESTIREIFTTFDYFSYVNYSEDVDYYTMLVRGTSDVIGFNYIDLIIDYSNKDSLRVVDFYSYLSGELFSTTIGRNIKMLLAENSAFSNILESLSLKEKLFTEHVSKLPLMDKYRRMGEFEGIVKLYEQLPEELKKEKIFLINVITASVQTQDDAFLKYVELYKEVYPDDPGLPMITLDYHLLRGELDIAMQRLDELDESVGGDNFLNNLRGNVKLIAEDTTAAIAYFEQTISNNPYQEEPYWSLLELELVQKRYADAAERLDTLAELFMYEFTEESMRAEPVYQGFLDSEEYRNWKSKKEANSK